MAGKTARPLEVTRLWLSGTSCPSTLGRSIPAVSEPAGTLHRPPRRPASPLKQNNTSEHTVIQNKILILLFDDMLHTFLFIVILALEIF